MGSERCVPELLGILLWLSVILAWAWPCLRLRRGPLAPPPPPLRRQRSGTPTSFPGLTVKPSCVACAEAPQEAPPPPPVITSTRGRPRQVDASIQFCPSRHCA